MSGASSVLTGQNIGTAKEVFKQKTGTTLQFRTVRGSGNTTVTQTGDEIIVYSTGGTGSINVQNIGSGEGVYDSTSGTTMLFKSITGSGETTVTTSGDTIIVNSIAGGTYNLASPAAICVGGIDVGTVLTGKTAFQLFEELLVPELCGTVTEPSTSISLSASGLYEIGCSLTQTVTGNFNRGCINPQYCSVCDKRSGLPNAYCFAGSGMPSGWQACTSLSASESSGHTVTIGSQTWSVCTRYDAGYAALSNKGNEYCAALPSGTTSAVSSCIIGTYPLFATCSTITTLSKISPLYNMSTANNIAINLASESGGNKQKFEIPCAWLGSPTNRPLCGVCQWNTVSNSWEYPGGSAASSLTLWTASSTSHTVQGNSVGYCQYTYNSTDRASVCIRLVF